MPHVAPSQTHHQYPYDLSVVLPVYNEVDNIHLVHDELADVLGSLDLRYEIIYVDDGSRDGTTARIVELCEAHPDVVRGVLLRRNFGQTAAIQAGIDHANGAVIALMDADLQNDPHDIPLMLDQMDTEGYDLVSGWRKNRQDKALSRKLPSHIANGLIARVTGVHLHDYGCTLKTYRREVLDHVRLYGEMHRFIPVLANAAGARIVERVVNHRARIHGKSKYGLWRTIKVVLDLMTVKFLTSYNTRPMYIFGGGGFILSMLSGLSVLVMLLSGIFAGDILWNSPWPIFAGIFAALAGQSILMGLMMEMLMRTYYESQGKGPYAIRQVINAHKHVATPVMETMIDAAG
ncbi:glycosyltransferase family 2 protein [Aggregatilinea lenta]|uniref:glycosyltransferase family 2 protein n=1 Tax=Aggregatilinea lenta TaxID=913108 RepID=UPI000E5C1380